MILDRDQNFLSVRLLAPAQILASTEPALNISQLDRTEFEITGLIAVIERQFETHPDRANFVDFQNQIQMHADKDGTDFLWDSSSHITSAYKHFYRLVKRDRRLRGEEVAAITSDDLPLDFVPVVPKY